MKNSSPEPRSSLRLPEAPLRESGRTFRLRFQIAEEVLQKEKTPSVPAAVACPRRELREPGNLACFYHSYKRQPLTGLTTGPISGYEQKIIRPIKSIRNKN